MAGVALALRGDGVQECRLNHPRLHAALRQASHALVEEGPRQGTLLDGYGDDHTVQVRRRGVHGSYGVYRLGAVLAEDEDVG